MFGLGMGEIMVILVVALLVLGPQKLPEAAKQIGKAIRELRRHTQNLQETIEQDEHIGGTVRELKSALRGDAFASLPKIPAPEQKPVAQGGAAAAPVAEGGAAAPPVAEGGPAAAPGAGGGPVVTVAPTPSAEAPQPGATPGAAVPGAEPQRHG